MGPNGMQHWEVPMTIKKATKVVPVAPTVALIEEVLGGEDEVKDVQCQAYSDDDGKIRVGKRLKGHKGVRFVPVGEKPVEIRSLRCFLYINP